MAGIIGAQDVWVAGFRVYAIRNDDANAALLDLGTIQSVNPNIATQAISLFDGDGGLRRKIDTTQIEQTETYEITTNNFAADNLSLFYLAPAPEAFSQATTVLNNVVHKAVIGPGKYVKLKDASGNLLYSINTINVTDVAGTTTYVENTDWKWVDKNRGIIQIISGGAITEGTTLHIDITPNAISGKRLIRPLAGTGEIKAKILIVMGRDKNASQTVREFNATLRPNSQSLSPENYGTLSFTAEVLTDISEQTVPAGRLLQFLGSLPS